MTEGKKRRTAQPAVSLETRQTWPEHWFREYLEATAAGDQERAVQANNRLAELARVNVHQVSEVQPCT
jgi:hypothetical protein